MKPFFLNLSLLLALTNLASAQNKLTKAEKKQGYTLLFNGKNTDGWHSYLKQKPEAAWTVKDGALTLDPKAEGQADLLTNNEYENYELALEWKISEKGNSGVIFGVHEDPAFGATYLTGIEMQVLDNVGADDNKKATHLAGSLYDLKAPSEAVAKPVGEWNMARIRKDNGHLTFWLNGTKIIETQIGSPEWETLLSNSKFRNWKNFAKYPKGHIALQDHGHEVAYRDIMIKEL
ncbi:3-keto-disaccharide hydrolase [Mucilaginibacter sp.]|uniref:3-keto-disaccharide hydrolase n=1 Tax=Mucilaginibacter sp. TaxID=1882438 RepID=UPI003AFFA41A